MLFFFSLEEKKTQRSLVVALCVLVVMSKNNPKTSAIVMSLAKKARKRHAGDEEDFEEIMESTMEYGPTAPKVKNVVSGKELMDNFGGSTKIFKQHLPHNTLFEVTNLRTVDVHGTDQAVYMDAKLVMQAVVEEDEEAEEGSQADQEATEGIVTTNFTDFNGAEINDLIQCTAPRSIAKSWVTGGITKDHIDNTILFMINESYDRDHEANKFMQNVHFNYQYYFGADLTAEVIEALKEGTVETSEAFKVFFVSCLEKSAEFKKRNEKYCKATERYAADKPQRANVKRAVSRAFK